MIAGRVYVVRTTLARPPKDKIVLCVSTEPGPYFLWFNSLPRPHGDGQLKLAASDHPALTRDCVLDCSRITAFSPLELSAAEVRADASSELLRKILDFLERSPPRTLPGKHRTLILEALRAVLATE